MAAFSFTRIQISGYLDTTYPDVRDPDIFGAFARVGSKGFRRLHVSRHPDAFYAAYSLCVGEMRKCFLFGQVACLFLIRGEGGFVSMKLTGEHFSELLYPFPIRREHNPKACEREDNQKKRRKKNKNKMSVCIEYSFVSHFVCK